MRLALPRSAAAVASLLVLCAGCGGGPSDTPPLAKVKGIITFDHKPLAKGTVQFVPDANQGTTGRMALGEIQEDGSFQLTTIRPGDGAQVGHHIVTVQAYDTPPFDPNKPVMTTPKALVPERYGDPKSSTLRTEVVAGKTNELTFNLTTAP